MMNNDSRYKGTIMGIIVNLDVMLAKRKMKLQDLAELVGITVQNLSILKLEKRKLFVFQHWRVFVNI